MRAAAKVKALVRAMAVEVSVLLVQSQSRSPAPTTLAQVFGAALAQEKPINALVRTT